MPYKKGDTVWWVNSSENLRTGSIAGVAGFVATGGCLFRVTQATTDVLIGESRLHPTRKQAINAKIAEIDAAHEQERAQWVAAMLEEGK
jgi:hypothetical protein